MEQVRLEVRNRSMILDRRDYVFITEDGAEVLRTHTEDLVHRITRYVNRRMRGAARVHGRAQLLGALRQFNSPKEGYTQFVVVETDMVMRLDALRGVKRDYALDEAIVRAIQARRPVDLQAMEAWTRGQGLWVGLSGKNQLLGGKARLAHAGIRTDFPPEKLVARSLLDKPDAFRGEHLWMLVVDDPFLDEVTGDGAFLVASTAPRCVHRTVSQRVRRCLEYEVQDAKRGEVYLRLEFNERVARHDTRILRVVEDGDLLHIEKEETASLDTGAKLVHEAGFKGTAIVVDELPERFRQFPMVNAVSNSSCIKSNALLACHGQEVLWGEGQRGFLLRLPVRMPSTGYERMKGHGNRLSLNVLSTVHSVAPPILERMVEARVDEGPGPVVHGLLWWAERLQPDFPADELPDLPVGTKAQLQEVWGEDFERRFAFGDPPDHMLFDTVGNPRGFVVRGRGGNQVLVPSARLLLSTLGPVEVEGEPGFWFPDYLNTLLQVIRMLDVAPARFAEAVRQLRDNVLGAANQMRKAHSIRVPGIHGVAIVIKGLDSLVVVPDRYGGFVGTIHREPTLNRDGVRRADVVPLAEARRRRIAHPSAAWLLEHLVPSDFEVVLADFDRLSLQNCDNDGDLVYLSHIEASERELGLLEERARRAPGFVDPDERFRALSLGFDKLRAEHEPFDLPPEVVHRACLETAGSARDVGSITHFKYTCQEALAHVGDWDLLGPLARISQAYIDGLKGPHQQSANLFAGLMRVWARMAAPCRAVRVEDVITCVRLSPGLERELRRAGYVDGVDFHSEVEVPHPALADEAFRRMKRPLVAILEEILGNLSEQGLASRAEIKRIRDALESEYGIYPSDHVQDQESLVRERRTRYRAVRQLYGISPLHGLADAEAMAERPLWERLLSLSLDLGGGADALEARAKRAIAHCPSPEHVTF